MERLQNQHFLTVFNKQFWENFAISLIVQPCEWAVTMETKVSEWACWDEPVICLTH